MTYELIKDRVSSRINFIPHAVPNEIFFPLEDSVRKSYKKQILGPDREDHFIAIWVNRNAKRKRPSDVVESWRVFLENLEKIHGHRNATLIMHTDPMDHEGPNLIKNVELQGVSNNVYFSTDRLDFEKMNVLYNISDACINISYAEGFGLSTLEGMMTGCPIVAIKTGGLTRQVVDHEDGSENGVALPVEFRSLVGSQAVPFIYEDYVTCETVAEGIMKMYNLSSEERLELREKCLNYVKKNFNINDTIDEWNKTMKDLLDNWKKDYKAWECFTL
tara:strand:- start:2203 stop:3027 length:825 start_codon:yes stop_codon:yes gene_type:complete